MTEEEWLSATDPASLLELLWGKASDRKLRLFGCGCWRLAGTSAFGREDLELEETVADGLAGVETLIDDEDENTFITDPFQRARWSLLWTGGPSTHPNSLRPSLACLLREIFGNPFHPVSVDSSWQTASVVALAQAAYEKRIPPEGTLCLDRLAVLADALEDAGCADQMILEHLRGSGPHYRGCFVVDAILGKK